MRGPRCGAAEPMNAPPLLQAPPWPQRLRAVLAPDRWTLAGSVLVALLLAIALPPLLDWAVLRAVGFGGSAADCRADAAGACWAVIAEKWRLIVFGRFPFDEPWRPAVATGVLIGALVASAMRKLSARGLLVLWVAALAVFFVLMRGGILGLTQVDTDQWGGLPLSVLLATLSSALAFPLAVAVALGRQSRLPAVRAVCGVYVELVRGVPLITVLFVASFMAPLVLPQGFNPDVLVRVIAGITLFAAAYMAEVIRGGLQAIPRGQLEAAAAMGLTPWQQQRLVVLPQALTHVLPALMNNVIAIFKDTSLVTIVSLYELTGALDLALNADPDWRTFKLEGYLFIAAIYFTGCQALAVWSRRLEAHLARGRR